MSIMGKDTEQYQTQMLNHKNLCLKFSQMCLLSPPWASSWLSIWKHSDLQNSHWYLVNITVRVYTKPNDIIEQKKNNQKQPKSNN